MAYGQGSLTEDKRTGKWKARYIGADGKQHCKTFGASEKVKARKFLATQTADRARGTWIDPRGAQTPFADWAETWFEGRHNLEPQSFNRDRSLFDNHVLPHFAAMPLGRIGPLEVRQWVAGLVGTLKPRTVRQCHRIFSSIMSTAVASKLIGEAPIGRGVVTLPKVQRKTERFLTEFELEGLIRELPEWARPIVYSAAYSGCRWQELAGLKGLHLDLNKGVLHVRGVFKRDKGRTYWAECPKTDASRRSVNLPLKLVAMLKELPRDTDSEFVFAGPQGGVIREENFRKRVWNPAVGRASLAPLTFHDLRHTHAAWLIRDGVQPLALQRRLGHKDIGTTMNVYGHLFPNAEDALVEILDRRWTEAEQENAKVISIQR